MSDLIYLNLKSPIKEQTFEQFLSKHFDCKSFLWVGDFFEYCVSNEIDQDKTYISLVTAMEGFKYHYSVFGNCNIRYSLRQQIELLAELAIQEKIQILASDDEISSISWILIEPDGFASTIQTKMIDEGLVIEDFYNFPLGDFRTEEAITEAERELLIKLMRPVYPKISIYYGDDGPVINGDFNKVKSGIDELKSFDHHYEIRPEGKTKWLDRTAKSDLFISIMKEYQRQLQKRLCLFPRNYSEVKNIPGGSDSEEYCILLAGLKEEKIIYKRRRISW